jgi:hypothetical protein
MVIGTGKHNTKNVNKMKKSVMERVHRGVTRGF